MAEELTLEVDNNEFQNDLEMGSGDQTSKTKETKSEEMNKDLEVGELPDSPQDRTVKRKGRGFEKSRSIRDLLGGYVREEAGEEKAIKPEKSVEGWILFVTGVHEEAQEEDLYEVFAEYGEIKNLHLNLDRRTGFAKGYALIEYEKYEAAKAAIESFDGSKIFNQTVRVDWAFIKSDRRHN